MVFFLFYLLKLYMICRCLEVNSHPQYQTGNTKVENCHLFWGNAQGNAWYSQHQNRYFRVYTTPGGGTQLWFG